MSFNPLNCFSNTYLESRASFLEVAKNKNAEIHSIPNSAKGPNGEDLFMDFAVFGAVDAKNALVVISGTHGPEGLCGSACQMGLMDSGMLADMSDIRLVLIHAHNPFGFAWQRRTNENNVDLNRNYVDFSEPFEPHPGYDKIRAGLVPDKLDDPAAAKILQEYEQEHGKVEYLAAMLTGQRHDPDGLFYGGTEAQWSNKMVQKYLPQFLEQQKAVVLIDIHTGLGPYGVPYLVHGYEKDSIQYARLGEAYTPDMRALADTEKLDEDLPTKPSGPIVLGVDEFLPDSVNYAFVVEYGTYETERVFAALRDDNWLHANGDMQSDLGKKIKQEMQEVFYPDDDKWRHMIWEKAEWTFTCALNLLRDQ